MGWVFTMLAAQMIEHFGMKAAWLSIGLVVLAVSVAPSLFLVVERPEDLGLLPDNAQAPSTTRLVQRASACASCTR